MKSLDEKSDAFDKKNPAPKKKDAPAQDKSVKQPQAAKPGKSDVKPPEKPKQTEKPPKTPKENKKAASVGGGGIGGKSGQTPAKEQTPQEKTAAMAKAAIEKYGTPPENTKSAQDAPTVPEPPRDATRPGEKETIVYIDHAELHPFKNHPFQVRDDDSMKSLVESVKERGFDQAALVRPREEGGYEIVAGHRRQAAAELAGYTNLPCVVRKMTDEEAILAMTESNFTYRSEIPRRLA